MHNQDVIDEIRNSEARKVTWVGFFVNTVLTITKIGAGILGHSSAMIADGIHSLSDFFTDIVVLVGFKFTEKPADEGHSYGHEKYETFATVIIGLVLFFAGFGILQKGVINVYGVLVENEIIARPGIIAVLAAIISIITKEMLYRYTKGVGEKIKSPAVIANGWHHRTDAFSSIGTLFGISCAYFLGEKWTILDPITAILVSMFIIIVAIKIMVPAVNELLEASLNEDEIKYITNLFDASIDVLNYHNMRTRRIGNKVAIEAHLQFDKDISLYDAHAVSDALEQKLRYYFGRRSIITFHLEPNKASDSDSIMVRLINQ
ncbi:Cation-efflux pump [Petrocella atlantisensis]|uniref:Cation-efflux pump n=1 Tax=Petrocella atlantisensis TaxID=2173034 RepID=A0A3P7S878_9FIRM|nr:cation diffusion facilitator family transporter [Petrocella atlantisensis]VDN48269.1 Cation-efflux pump [Petrocella atlantisensis]